MKKIFVRTGPNGEIEVEAMGYIGKQCLKEAAFVEDVLGDITDMKEKAEWWLVNGRQVREEKERTNLQLDKLCG